MGLRVFCTDRQPINGLQAVLRNLLRVVDVMPVVPVAAWDGQTHGLGIPTFCLGRLVPLLNDRYQRIGDLVCGTMVVVERPAQAGRFPQLEDRRVGRLAEPIPAAFRPDRFLSLAVVT